MAESVDTRHWTHRLFVERLELFLPFLEKAEDRAEAEIAVLARLLGELGLPSGGRILDTACGIGRHALPLARRGYRVTGFDIDPLYVERARDRAAVQSGYAEVFVGDVCEVGSHLAGREPFYAIANMFMSIDYCGRASDLALFQGLGSIVYNNWEFYEGSGTDLCLRLKLDLDHTAHSADDLRGMVEEAGWEFVEGLNSQREDDLRLAGVTP